jgi:ubiquinone/menaquinone biosynthesis C-methylase UbiE
VTDVEGTMRDYTYKILFDSEEDHWWLASRRRMVVDWVMQGYPGRIDLRILDVGCGTGMMLVEMARLGQAQGVDASDEALRFCHRRGLTAVRKCNVLELPFPDSSFDVLTAVDILEHIDDDLGALQEWSRVLKPGGRLYLFVPAHRWLWSLQDEISGHRRRYTAHGLRRVVEQANLQVERQSYVSTLLFPVIVMGRIWLKVLRRFTEIKTENTLHPSWSNGILRRVFSAEIPLLRRVNFPFGASLLCVARKPS